MSTSQPSTVTLYHNPNCSKSRGALELLASLAQTNNLTLELVEYLDSPPDKATLTLLLDQLQGTPQELVRNDKNFKALGLNFSDYINTQAVIDLLLEHPVLMQRPLAIYNNKAAIGRPPEALLELFQ